MAYWIAYDQSTNALLGLSDTAIPPKEGTVVTQYDGEMPDMSRLAWNAATLDWYEKPRQVLTKREFLKRFTPQEYGAIKTAAAANATVDYYWQLFTLAEEVNMSDPDTNSGINLLEQAGLLASGRAAEILA